MSLLLEEKGVCLCLNLKDFCEDMTFSTLKQVLRGGFVRLIQIGRLPNSNFQLF